MRSLYVRVRHTVGDRHPTPGCNISNRPPVVIIITLIAIAIITGPRSHDRIYRYRGRSFLRQRSVVVRSFRPMALDRAERYFVSS